MRIERWFQRPSSSHPDEPARPGPAARLGTRQPATSDPEPSGASPVQARADPPATDSAREGSRLTYLPALDGLRALAVLAVLLYHADAPWLPGGFLGVEVFFVISGYLITSLLLAEWHRTGSVDVKGFYLRRARRLLPAVFAMMLTTLTLAALFLPEETSGLRGDALAAVGYVMNWHLIYEQKSYFEVMGRPSLLQHLWSLAVEEQFYLLWPLLLAVGARRLGPRRLVVAALAGAVASTTLMAVLYAPGQDPSRLYYGSDTRAAGLLFGSALALAWRPGRAVRTAVARGFDLLGVLAVGGLVWLFILLDEFQPFLYQGGFTTLALTTGLVIISAVHPGARVMSFVLGSPPMRWVGTRSYSIYLWHWPIFMVTRPQLDLPLDGPVAMGLRIAMTLLVAEMSYRYVETPFRAGALGRAWQAMRSSHGPSQRQLVLRWAGLALSGFALAVVVVASLSQSQPPAYSAYAALDAAKSLDASRPGVVTANSAPAAGSASTPGPPSGLAEQRSATSPSGNPTDNQWIDGLSHVSATPAAAGTTNDQPPGITPEKAADEATPSATAAAQASASTAPSEAPITAIGDSVMLFAGKELHQALPSMEIDAEIGLKIPGAINIVRTRKAAGRLGRIVIIHIGNNSGIGRKELAEMMDLLSDRRLVVLVNLKVPRRWEAPNNTIISDAAAKYPNAVLVDWHAATADQPGLFRNDGVHPHPEGAYLYAQLIAARIAGD